MTAWMLYLIVNLWQILLLLNLVNFLPRKWCRVMNTAIWNWWVLRILWFHTMKLEASVQKCLIDICQVPVDAIRQPTPDPLLATTVVRSSPKLTRRMRYVYNFSYVSTTLWYKLQEYYKLKIIDFWENLILLNCWFLNYLLKLLLIWPYYGINRW